MKVAIVGTSQNLNENEMRAAQNLCSVILTENNRLHTTLISGGAKGIDSIANAVAEGLYIPSIIFKPKGHLTKDYLERNLQIAQECDELYCITTNVHTKKCYHHDPPQDHQKTAGCWTMREAERLNKPCRLFVINR